MKRAASMIAIAAFACGPGNRNSPGGDDSGGTDAGASGSGSNTGSGSNAGIVYVYAHTESTLYRVDPDSLAISEIGDFKWPNNSTDTMTDIAIDKDGNMVGVSFDKVYKVDTGTAQTTLLSGSLQGMFNGLSYVPATYVNQTGDDVLVGTRNTDGAVFEIDPMTGSATQIGDMGNGFSSSGDLVAVDGFGIVQTVPGDGGDTLATLATGTFAATAIGNTGYGSIWGLAFWKNKVFGFTDDGAFITIDPTTGAATLVSENFEGWYGAAVTTTAPVIQ
ncbi:MAG TPA: hypothetical protein VGG28_06910 [Kofleriaceae bacterium]|jgi:hypothetical protein